MPAPERNATHHKTLHANFRVPPYYIKQPRFSAATEETLKVCIVQNHKQKNQQSRACAQAPRRAKWAGRSGCWEVVQLLKCLLDTHGTRVWSPSAQVRRQAGWFASVTQVLKTGGSQSRQSVSPGSEREPVSRYKGRVAEEDTQPQ